MTTGNRTFGNTYGGGSRVWSGSDGKSRENNYTCTFRNYSNPVIQYSTNGGATWNSAQLSAIAGRPSFTAPSAASQDILKTRVLGGVLGKYRQHDFSAAVFLGELPETVRMVVEPSIAVLKAYRQTRRGQFRQAKRTLTKMAGPFRIDRTASSAWLSLRYGWLPLISDVHSAADAYQTLTSDKKPKVIRVRSKAKIPSTWTWTNITPTKIQSELSLAIVLKTTVYPSYAESLGFTNPALLAWELLPGSFILDWVYDVGSWLKLVCAFPTGSSTSYITTSFWNTSYQGSVKHPSWRFKGTEGVYDRKHSIQRSVTGSITVPPPRLKNPFNGTLTRLGDMIALARALT